MSTTTLTRQEALRAALDWIDTLPGSTPLPAMPGFERDLFESLLADQMDGWPELDYPEAISMALEWIDAVPADIAAQFPPLTLRADIEAAAAAHESPSVEM